MKGEPRIITGQVMYLGPHVGFLGLHYNKTYRDGIDPQLYDWITRCPALGELFIPVDKIATVRKELNFDYAHNMRGETGRHVTFYREVQKWLATAKQKQQESPSGITLEKHHA
jgi:hypothetical protein